ncbi:MAG: hypothetical protein ISS00_00085 [Candidatus Marinimicrobia bacterium]|nr:hypothetical protein [Candidatus Neomarinimicrobiota bacterium]
MKSTIHIIGTGTIGEPLIGLLLDFKDDLGLEQITFHKKTPLTTDRSKVIALLKRGAKLAVDADRKHDFQAIGIEPVLETEQAIDNADVVIDCTPSGIGHANKTRYYKHFLHNTKGFIAQGSEHGFGKPYARGINDSALVAGDDRFVQVVSCNTHNLCVLVETIGGKNYNENIKDGRFVCIRRSNDISQNTGFSPSPDVGKHKDAKYGTHHARDAAELFQTLGFDLNLHSSALKLNTQYMHSLWFSIVLDEKITREEVIRRLKTNDRVAMTEKTTANQVFSFGRDHGHYGRILNQTVIVTPTIQVRNENEVIGFCFTPQDGNSLLSSISAAMWMINPDDYSDKVQCLGKYFFSEV